MYGKFDAERFAPTAMTVHQLKAYTLIVIYCSESKFYGQTAIGQRLMYRTYRASYNIVKYLEQTLEFVQTT